MDYQPFHSGVGIDEVLQQRSLAERLTELADTEYPDNTYEEGVLDTLNWLLSSRPSSAPLDIIYEKNEETDDD